MSYYDGLTPTYTLRIEQSDRVLVDTMVEIPATTEGIAKGKKTIQRLMNEYAPVIKALSTEPEPPKLALENQAPIAPTDLPPEPEPDPKGKLGGSMGLLHLHCRECGRTFTTFLREYQTEMDCKCGHQIDLTAPLARYRFTCPYCEREGWGQTNLKDPDITVRCKCGGDINLRWVSKAKEYQN